MVAAGSVTQVLGAFTLWASRHSTPGNVEHPVNEKLSAGWQPWQPTPEALPRFNPFSSVQYPASNSSVAPAADEPEDRVEADARAGARIA